MLDSECQDGGHIDGLHSLLISRPFQHFMLHAFGMKLSFLLFSLAQYVLCTCACTVFSVLD